MQSYYITRERLTDGGGGRREDPALVQVVKTSVRGTEMYSLFF